MGEGLGGEGAVVAVARTQYITCDTAPGSALRQHRIARHPRQIAGSVAVEVAAPVGLDVDP